MNCVAGMLPSEGEGRRRTEYLPRTSDAYKHDIKSVNNMKISDSSDVSDMNKNNNNMKKKS